MEYSYLFLVLLVIPFIAMVFPKKFSFKGKAKWFWVVAGLVLVLALVIFLAPLLWRTLGGVSSPLVWGGLAFVALLGIIAFLNRRKAVDILASAASLAVVLGLVAVVSWGITDINGTADKVAGCSNDLLRANSRVEIGDTPTFMRVCGTYTTYLRIPRLTNKRLEVTLVENRVSDVYSIHDLFVVCRYGDTTPECMPNGLSPSDASLTPRKRAYIQAFATLKTPIQIEAEMVYP